MKTISTTAIVALRAASLGFGAAAPVLAQDAAPATPAVQAQPADPAAAGPADFRKGPGLRPGAHRGGMPGSGLGLFGFDRGAESIEIALVRLSHAIDLTDEQTVLLETLKTDALAAAAAFDAATGGLRPAAPGAGDAATAPDLSQRFDNRIALEQARLAALEAVQPAFTAFSDCLTDEQQAELTAKRSERPAGFGHHGGPGNVGGHGQHDMGPDKR